MIFRVTLLSLLVIFINWPASSPAEQRNPVFALTLPGQEWALEFSAPGFLVEKKTLGPRDDSMYFFASNQDTRVNISAFMEKTAGKVTPKDCRDFYWNGTKKTPLKKEQIEMYDSGDMAVVEYMVRTFRGREMNQKNLFAYLARDRYWGYIHLSKIRFVPDEEGLFKLILASIRFNESYQPTAPELLEYGNLSLFRKDFAGAIAYYRKALELDKHRKILGRQGWITLVDQLGMAYELSGDFVKAQETYEWAISREPEYPMFFYNLACTFAQMGKVDETLRNLRLAYKYKDNVLAVEKFPNPRSDSSFKKYLNNQMFLAVLREME